jgi:hypothetical protein
MRKNNVSLSLALALLLVGGDIGPWQLAVLSQTEKKTVLEFAFKNMRLNLLRSDIAYFEGATAARF